MRAGWLAAGLGMAVLVCAAPGARAAGAGRGDWIGVWPGRMGAHGAAAGGAGRMEAPILAAPGLAYTILDYPQTPYTLVFGINPGAVKGVPTLIVGVGGPGLGPAGGAVTNFGLSIVQKKSPSAVYSFYPIAVAGVSLTVLGVNDGQELVGSINDANPHGFTLKGSVYSQFDVPFAGATFTEADAVNNAGMVTGYWGAADGTQHGFLLNKGVFNEVPDYPGATVTNVLGINSAGDLSGNVTDSTGVTHGFLLRNGVYTLFDPPGSVYTIGAGLNDSDEVVGFYCTSVCSLSHPSVAHGFAYKNGVITTFDIPQSPETEPLEVNNAGVIAGYYEESGSGFLHGFTVPTP